MKEVQAFTIKRSEWGKDELLCGDKKRCCVGTYLKACGLDDADLDQQGCASDLFTHRDEPIEVPEWLQGYEGGRLSDSRLAVWLYGINDSWFLTQAEREAEIIARFADVGITVTFEE